jgi:catechol 2,3-dioxygenase-like lactoylglutathione lyase family enzyme
MRMFLEAALGLHLVEERSFPDDQIETAYLSYGCGVQVELVELGEPGARQRRLGKLAPSRIEHIAIEVDDLDKMRPQLAAAGVEMDSDQPLRSGDSRVLFSRPETSRGIVLQVFDRNVVDGG